MTGKNILGKIIIVTLLVTISLFLFISAALAADDPDFVYYQVQAGDSLWLIGWKFETTADAIKSINNLSSTQIMPGQVLKIPKSTGFVRDLPTSVNYQVKSGDSLYLIGEKFGISVAELQKVNSLTGSAIYVGQVLTVPLPAQSRYTVQNGDSLFLLAEKFNTTMEALRIINRMNSNLLWIGQVLFVPSSGTQPTDNGGGDPPAPIPPVGGQWGEIPLGVILYHVQAGENLWTIAKRYNTKEPAIAVTNHLHTDLVMLNQPMFIPQNSNKSVTIPYPSAYKKDGFGELLDWEYASWVLDTYNTATLQDLNTGRTFKVRRLGGSNHADMEPLTAADTAVMKDIYGGQWSWLTRAVLVFVDGKVIAGSMAGMPHSIKTIQDNNFPGHFDLHFLNSRTHHDNSIDPEHQKMVQKAAGN